jgi:tRNA threonylcarbamoyladenosine biosynthesis protein TsaB
MKILAMDTAAAACSVAIWDEGRVIAHDFQEMARGHAQELLPIIQAVLKTAQLKIEDLDALAVTIGPGAFTGLRIGLATARGFAVAASLPVIGVTTLEALSHAVSLEARTGTVLLACLDAKRADIYAQAFDERGNPLSQAVAQLPEDLCSLIPDHTRPILVAGDCYQRINAALKEQGYDVHQASVHLPDARDVVEIAAKRGIMGCEESPSAFYIRPPDAALPKDGGRLRP